MSLVIRRVRAEDEPRWRELWDAYTRFYEREPVEQITQHTWSRIMDDNAPVHSIAAETETGIVSIANYLTHENTSELTKVCYLQDLYVDPAHRARGVGRALIDWLRAEVQRRGWSQLYWQTKENNYRARALYDQYTPHSGFVRYVLRYPTTLAS
jgi:GNAT superfamily N-acetyltransferase